MFTALAFCSTRDAIRILMSIWSSLDDNDDTSVAARAFTVLYLQIISTIHLQVLDHFHDLRSFNYIVCFTSSSTLLFLYSGFTQGKWDVQTRIIYRDQEVSTVLDSQNLFWVVLFLVLSIRALTCTFLPQFSTYLAEILLSVIARQSLLAKCIRSYLCNLIRYN